MCYKFTTILNWNKKTATYVGRFSKTPDYFQWGGLLRLRRGHGYDK